MYIDKTKLLAIDLELGKRLLGADLRAAKDILSMLVSSLPEIQEQLATTLAEGKQERLAAIVHKLYGATCYCGVPRLKIVVEKLSSSLEKRDAMSVLEPLCTAVQEEIQAVLDAYAENPEYR